MSKLSKLTAEQAARILVAIQANTDFAFTSTAQRKLTDALCALDLGDGGGESDVCPTCGSSSKEVHYCSLYGGGHVKECTDPWHSSVSASEQPAKETS